MVAPSSMEPYPDVSPRTAMHLVHISNMKLDAEIFSDRSLSIQRRILIKNFLTMLYDMCPIEWFDEEEPLEEEEWMDQAPSGTEAYSDASTQDYDYGYDYYGQDPSGYSSSTSHSSHSSQDRYDSRYDSNPNDRDEFGLEHESVLSPAVAAAVVAVAARRKPNARKTNRVQPNRPSSMDLQAYLSSVFNVDWSVGLSSTEDSLFTSPGSRKSLRLSMSSLSSLNEKSSPSAQAAFSSLSDSRTSPNHSSSSSRTPSLKEAGPRYKADDGAKSSPRSKIAASYDPNGKSEYVEEDDANSYSHPSQSWKNQASASTSHPNGNHGYHHPSGVNNGSSLQSSDVYNNPNNPETHIHNHYHIHIHNYSSENGNLKRSPSVGSKSSDRPPPVIRSARYPKPEPRQDQQPMASTSNFPQPPWAIPANNAWAPQPNMSTQSPVSPVMMAVAGPLTSSSSSPSSSVSYPPEKSSDFVFISNTGEEQPYLATVPSVSGQYSLSQPPPPYTQSPNKTPKSESGSPPARRLTKKMLPSFRPPIFTTKPQQSQQQQQQSQQPQSSGTASSAATNPQSQRLIDYQLQYQERQKMFVNKEEDVKESQRSTENLGFIRQLFRQNSKKKGIAFISAPLPVSSSSSSLT
ncbi:hypothetical protein BGX34_002139 [Mortierella sp. NVP85]|nr:hypothetical protein BGX34_002139 [Mortierella sp. NVP85]